MTESVNVTPPASTVISTDFFEPIPGITDAQVLANLSTAASLKRIADVLERLFPPGLPADSVRKKFPRFFGT